MQLNRNSEAPLAIVTGAAGFLGKHAALALAEAGFEVIGTGIGDLVSDDLNWSKMARYYSTPITAQSVRELLANKKAPSVIFHAAGGASVGLSWRDPESDRKNTLGATEILLEGIASFAPNTKLIFASSAAVYGEQAIQPIAETAAYAPVSPYGTHKMEAEKACLAAAQKTGLKLTILRFFSLYGTHLRKQILWDLIHRLAENPSEIQLGGLGTETRDFLHASDAAKLVVMAARHEKKVPVIINGGTGISTTVRELAESVVKELGMSTRILFSGERPKGDPAHLVAKITLAAELGFAPHFTLQQGLKDYISWAKSVAQQGSMR
jgi:UDP-glucose 4-epimerase